MTKYQELYKAFVDDMSRHYENTNDCLGFGHNLVLRMVNYLGWNENVEYIALKSDIDSTSSSTSSTPLSFPLEDKSKDKLGKIAYLVDGDFWHFGVRLKLLCNQIAGRNKEVKFIIPFFIKKDKASQFIVKIDKNGKEYKSYQDGHFDDLYELVFERLKKVIELGVQNLLDRGEESKKFKETGIFLSLEELEKLKELTNQGKISIPFVE
jgi:hypothetical protein